MNKIDRTTLSLSEAAVAKATSGLIAFRQGAYEVGRDQYRAAVSEFRELGERQRAAAAEVFWAREELLAGSGCAVEAVTRAVNDSADLKGYRDLEDLRNLIQAGTFAFKPSCSHRAHE